ncbi:MAG: glycosyl hydrolase family 79 C-terminal domain-containing protein [Terracidiphilus sp.]
MIRPSRREFCSIAAALGTSALIAPNKLLAQPAALQISLVIDPAIRLAEVPADFMGLSYESGQLTYPDFFSPQNSALIEMFRTLSPAGVLRLGGNLSEFTAWSETEPATPPEAGGVVGPDPGHRETRTFTITPRPIRNLQGFLNATGWRCIYGLNLGGGTVEQALAEGGFVAKTLGPQLICVQFGNEPDLFRHHDQGNKPWTYDEYLAKWKRFRAAFHEKLPEVAVAGPDTASSEEWVKQFTEDVPREVMLVTSHYYPLGPPTDPSMTIEMLLHPVARFATSCRHEIESAKAAGLPLRMAEGNSCYNAGRQGVSDTFASALWAADYCLQIASLGCVGVNLHGGANGYYSPIVGSIGSGFTARPEYYGLMLAQEFAGRTLHKATLEAQGANVTAYASAGDRETGLIAIINKDGRDAEVTIAESSAGFKRARVERLEASAIDAKDGITFGESIVRSNAQFHPRAGEPLKSHSGKLQIHVPGYSAALIRLA